MRKSIKDKHKKIESRTVEMKFSESLILRCRWNCQEMWKQQDFSSPSVFILTTVSQSPCPEDAGNASIHNWRGKKKNLKISSVLWYLHSSQTKTSNSCYFFVWKCKCYNFYTHTQSCRCMFLQSMTTWAIHKATCCPINKKHLIADPYSDITCWLDSTRTWLQLGTATHMLCSAPTWQRSSPQPEATHHLAAGTRSWYRLRPREEQGGAAAEDRLLASRKHASACSGTGRLDSMQGCPKGQRGPEELVNLQEQPLQSTTTDLRQGAR